MTVVVDESSTGSGRDRLESVLKRAADVGASDLLLVADCPPCALSRGSWCDLDAQRLAPGDVEALVLSFLTDAQRQALDKSGDVDLGLDVEAVGRIRVNVHRQRRTLAAAIRFIADHPPEFDDLNLPAAIARFADLPRGLVLVTGGTGSGKSTTSAALIERINRTRRAHVITLEDPIEYRFTNDQCIIEQREIGIDAPSFAGALRHVVRQKPDVILVGEMRDRETIATTLTAAELGHLVIATMHTVSAAQTIERIVDVFDGAQQAYVRIQLAVTLQAVVCQTLLRADTPCGLVPATEVMVRTPAVARAIRDNELHLLGGMIETGRNRGMHLLDHKLAELVARGVLAVDEAMARVVDAEAFRRQLDRSAGESPKR